MSASAKSYAWLRRARGVILDAHFPPFAPNVELDATHTVRMMKRVGANTICLGVIGKWAIFPNDFVPPHPGLGGRDLIREIVEAAKVEKFSVTLSVPLYPALSVKLVEEMRPDWQWRGPAGKPRYLSHFGGGPVTPICLNSPYRQAFLGVIRQVVADYEVQALVLESLVPGGFAAEGVCYCESCKKAAVSKFGRELPGPAAGTPEEEDLLAQFQDWYRRLGTEMVEEARALARSGKGLPLLLAEGDSPPDADFGRFGAVDGVIVGGGGLMDRIHTASFRAGASEVVLQQIGRSDRWPRLLLHRNELSQETITAAACGAAPVIAHGNKLFYDEVQAAPISRAFGFLIRNDELLEGLTPARFAVVCADGSGEMSDEARGISYALTNAHVQARPVPMSVLDSPDELDRCPVLCLGDVGRLSPERVDAVTRYVEKGGGLVATYRTSRLDDLKQERDEFGLGELLGIRPLKLTMDQHSRMMDHQGHGDPTDMGIALAEQPAGALAVAMLPKLLPQARFLPIAAGEDVFVAAQTVFGGRDDALCPAITLREVGEGRAVYISGALGDLYLKHRLPGIRDLIAACVNWAGGGWAPFSVLGPASLYALLAEKADLRVLFLINHTGEKHDHPDAPIEHITPLEKIAVCLRVQGAVGTVRELVSGKELDFERTKNLVQLTVPRIEEFAVLAIAGHGPKAEPGLKL